jgi:hypothetical protein
MTPLRFSFDPVRSGVWINARSNLHPINTETHGLEGWVEAAPSSDGSLDLTVPVTGSLELSAERLSSGNGLYDRELRRRIDSRRFPVIVGQITHVTGTDERGRYMVTGDLSFHGRVRTFEHDMSIQVIDDTAIEMRGEYVFDIREFNMQPPSMLMLKVYPEVAVRVELFGRRKR